MIARKLLKCAVFAFTGGLAGALGAGLAKRFAFQVGPPDPPPEPEPDSDPPPAARPRRKRR